jgi:hypothetical protein
VHGAPTMTRRLSLAVAALLSCLPLVVPACGGDDSAQTGDESDLIEGGLASKRITTQAEYDGFAFTDGGVILPGKSVKFLIDNRNKNAADIFYMNANYKEGDKTPDAARYHYYFAERVVASFSESLESFNRVTYSTQDKSYYAGTVQTYTYKGKLIYGIQLYPEDVASEERILDAVKVVQKSFVIPASQLAFVATGPQQTTKTVAAALKSLGVLNLTIDQVLDGITYLPMNQGEAWGYLRIFPTDVEALTPMDIPVFDELPLDLAVVAATVTKAFQDASCHVNLKSKERGTPDMVLRDAGPQNGRLAGFSNKPVHLVVGPNEFTIAASTDAEVKQKLQEKLDAPWTAVPYEPATALLTFSDMCKTSAAECLALPKKYGTKSSNLGFMTNRNVLGRTSDAGSPSAKSGYNLVSPGFGVPLKFYKDFVAYGPNSDLRSKIDALIDGEKKGALSPKTRGEMVEALQNAFFVAKFPPGMLEGLKTKLSATLPGITKIKVRSSANAEDLPHFDGAGLYSSYGAHVNATDNPDGSCERAVGVDGVVTKEEMNPKTFACGIKGVYASLWNKRAVEERSYAHLEHATATMGLTVVPKYDLESDIASNSVVVTRVLSSNDVYGYTFASQVGENLVTNPTPGTLPEELIAAFVDPQNPPSFIVTHYAVPEPGAAALAHTVLTNAQMLTLLDITKTVEVAYCKAKPTYYEGDCSFVPLDIEKPSALDFEFKLLENGHFIAKQVREFGGQ